MKRGTRPWGVLLLWCATPVRVRGKNSSNGGCGNTRMPYLRRGGHHWQASLFERVMALRSHGTTVYVISVFPDTKSECSTSFVWRFWRYTFQVFPGEGKRLLFNPVTRNTSYLRSGSHDSVQPGKEGVYHVVLCCT